jgi:hypothetical protein
MPEASLSTERALNQHENDLEVLPKVVVVTPSVVEGRSATGGLALQHPSFDLKVILKQQA